MACGSDSKPLDYKTENVERHVHPMKGNGNPPLVRRAQGPVGQDLPSSGTPITIIKRSLVLPIIEKSIRFERQENSGDPLAG